MVDIGKLFDTEYAKRNLPRALISGAILGVAFRFTVANQTYKDVKDQIDDYATYMLADNLKDVVNAVIPTAGEGAGTAIAMFIPARMKMGNWIADKLVAIPSGKTENDVVDPAALNIASLVVGGIAALAVYITSDMIDAAVDGTPAPKRRSSPI